MNRTQVQTIATHEIRQGFQNKSFLALTLLVLLLFTVATVVSTNAHRRSQQEIRVLQDTVARQWQEQPSRHPHRVAHYGYLAFRPRSPLGFFDFGVSDFTGNSIFLEAHVQNSANFSEARQDSSLLRFGTLTPAFVFQTLIPLLVIFLVGTTITKERESGTLPQTLSLGVGWKELLLGKTLGNLMLLAMLTGPVLSFVTLPAAYASGSLGEQNLIRLILLAGFYLLYLFLWVSLSVIISTLSSSSGRSTVVLLTVWIATTSFLPKALPSLGAYLHPAPSRPEFEHRLHLEAVGAGHGHDPKDAHFEKKKNDTLKLYGVDSVDELPVNWRGMAMQEGERASTDVYRRHFEELQETYKLQLATSRIGAVFSPYLAIKNLSATLCGTDLESAVRFEREAEKYRYDLIQKLNDLHIHEIDYEGDKEQRVSSAHWKDFDSFHFTPPSLASDLSRTRSLMVLLLAQAGLLLTVLLNMKGQAR